MSTFSIRKAFPGLYHAGYQGVLPADTAELNANWMGNFVHPLFNMAAVQDFPNDAHGRSQPLANLGRCHAFADVG